MIARSYFRILALRLAAWLEGRKRWYRVRFYATKNGQLLTDYRKATSGRAAIRETRKQYADTYPGFCLCDVERIA